MYFVALTASCKTLHFVARQHIGMKMRLIWALILILIVGCSTALFMDFTSENNSKVKEIKNEDLLRTSNSTMLSWSKANITVHKMQFANNSVTNNTKQESHEQKNFVGRTKNSYPLLSSILLVCIVVIAAAILFGHNRVNCLSKKSPRRKEETTQNVFGCEVP